MPGRDARPRGGWHRDAGDARGGGWMLGEGDAWGDAGGYRGLHGQKELTLEQQLVADNGEQGVCLCPP